MEKICCPHCGHEFCETCSDLLDALPYRRCCNCNRASEDRSWRTYEDSMAASLSMALPKDGS